MLRKGQTRFLSFRRGHALLDTLSQLDLARRDAPHEVPDCPLLHINNRPGPTSTRSKHLAHEPAPSSKVISELLRPRPVAPANPKRRVSDVRSEVPKRTFEP